MVLKKAVPRYVVLGGAGAIRRVIVRDLYESNSKNEVLVADYNHEAASGIAKSYRSKRITAAFADARYPSRLASVLGDQMVVVNCTRHQLNLNVMEAALRARVHYVDLGGLFIWTRRQLRFHRPF